MKSRAENLMIADLLRNDLSRSCELGSVNVTELCALESFCHGASTGDDRRRDRVYQYRGRRETSLPARKHDGRAERRTCEILDDLEGRARGCYAGCWASLL